MIPRHCFNTRLLPDCILLRRRAERSDVPVKALYRLIFIMNNIGQHWRRPVNLYRGSPFLMQSNTNNEAERAGEYPNFSMVF
jgi:hypothetical protein